MKFWSSCIAAIICCVSAPLLADTWSAVENISPETSPRSILYSGIAVDSTGNAYAAWDQGDGTTNAINVSKFNASSGTWSTPEAVSLTNVEAPQIAATNDGRAIAVWRRVDWDNNYVKVEYAVLNSGTWSFGATIDTSHPDNENEQTPRVGIDGNNNAIVVWQVGGDHGSVIRSSTYSFDNDIWSDVTDISAIGTNSRGNISLSVNSAGAAIAVWEFQDLVNASFAVESNRYVGGNWQTPETVVSSNMNGFFRPKVKINSIGFAAASWEEWNPDSYAITIKAALRTGYWNSPTTLSEGGNFATPDSIYLSDISLDNSGDAIAVWTLFNGSNNTGVVQARVYQDGQWNANTFDLTGPCVESALARIAIDASGNGHVIYVSRNSYTSPTVVKTTSYDKATNTWSLSQVLDDAPQGGLFPDIAVNAKGDAFALWWGSYFSGNDQVAPGHVRSTHLQGSAQVLPPSSISGTQTLHNYIVSQDLVNTITWGSSPSTNIVAYQVYRDGSLIAILSSGENSFDDHQRTIGQSYTYEVRALSSNGTLSAAASVTIH